ncbi:pectate lyase [Algoriphagus halophytocola]|uniref:Pectate lyase n=1 Tax=Algoriphagus halophytocola TaxID=2991499 RepID=A0ABY6MPQ7_9BACT|nr:MULTISPECIES: pectate lyase [unclassified Algoriphagus]UZD24517.1 pectate lyase [Algoriphagus sp. TR-M5]WBL41881.1 pectate lyase [Algoriphagus sp. TR-M9]
MKLPYVLVLIWLVYNSCAAQEVGLPDEEKPLAFPFAEGFGKYTTGGRGGEIYIVTNLNDDGPGSLRDGIQKKEPRIIVFEVAGNIILKSSLDINHGDLTIAGQSAPGGGITLQGYPIKIKADNIIIRYIRSRLGDLSKVQDDAMSSIRNKDIIIDHCSLSWATDECGSFYDNENFTLQWSILSESLNKSVHEKGEHGYGGIWGGKKASFLYNLLADHNSRNPRFNGARYHKEPAREWVDFRNNVIYNWKGNSAYAGEEGQYNIVNNYFKPGPATKSNRDRIVEPYEPYASFYVSGNVMEGSDQVTEDNSLGIQGVDPNLVEAAKEFDFANAVTMTAYEAFKAVLNRVGASAFRDEVDLRIVKEVEIGQNQFGSEGIIDSQTQVGGWPVLPKGEVSLDTDRDGMPDQWEVAMNLNPKDPSDSKEYTLAKTYTNVEVYLNSLLR